MTMVRRRQERIIGYQLDAVSELFSVFVMAADSMLSQTFSLLAHGASYVLCFFVRCCKLPVIGSSRKSSGSSHKSSGLSYLISVSSETMQLQYFR